MDPSTEKLIPEFRARLQATGKEAEVDKQLQQGKEGGLTDITLYRFLRAAENDVGTAERKLITWAAWRADHPIGWVPKDEMAELLASNVVYLQGNSPDGQPLLVLRVKSYVSAGDEEKFTKVLCFAKDAALLQADVTKNPGRSLCMVFDLEGSGSKNITLNDARALIAALQNYYTGRMTKIWLYQPPFFFTLLWKAICPFLNPHAKYVLDFTQKNEVLEKMLQVYDIETIPSIYGGKAELIKLSAKI